MKVGRGSGRGGGWGLRCKQDVQRTQIPFGECGHRNFFKSPARNLMSPFHYHTLSYTIKSREGSSWWGLCGMRPCLPATCSLSRRGLAADAASAAQRSAVCECVSV
jgi:hypothetical protein